tara:strand:+ start:9464 stop:10306 length:843 start_codon:yes stop_codon:yes gene_type:complete
MFYLIGLGLNENSITAEALQAIQKSDKIYLENYTVDFPYSIKDLEKSINKLLKSFGNPKILENSSTKKGGSSATAELEESNLISKTAKTNTNKKTKIIPLPREKVEDESIISQAKNQNISLLVYGDALSATTHISLISTCKNQKIKYKIFHNTSILTAIAETGLQLYKFGKTASMPNWQEHKNKPTSFINYIKQNQSIKAHTLLLIDINLPLKNAKQQLQQAAEKEKLKLSKIILLSNAGTDKQKISYNTLDKLPNTTPPPYTLIIPSDLHFSEEEFLSR